MTLIVLDGKGEGLKSNSDFVSPGGYSDLVHMVTVADTTYQNTNNYPIWFHAKIGFSTSYQAQVSSNGTSWTELAAGDGSAPTFLCVHVNPNTYYRVTGGIWGGYGTAKGANGDVRTG